ncbi:conserved hypothetical protein [Leishmania major strain Friedlin]|uniref:Uncharacterized protein n=1 Tax=Leishmania major TaxID=5664 RepID=Q4QJ40_LEIMA|nr:conserved hypothetical protein [Leishmania major strain Friedlin]CAG9568832.1 hypothetical_protein_-_conserved [Leishmania major strain Friedlin]CAJ02082.1 conserved hypothetical protein [Leishmania major strain Friedlin]|eukprot:XP_001680808.1 conserved hypothetical protein [Leishmania major strain Friedlin]
MAYCIPPRVVRRLCDSEWFKTEFVDKETGTVNNDLAVVSSQCRSVGQASNHEYAQLISSSFRPFIEKVLPLPASACDSGAAECGGCWFWETYRHALFGENVLIHLGGSGISLAEDRLDAQVELRLRMCASNNLALPPQHRTKALLHGSAKLEVVYALALSVALHVAKQPLLEHGEGPQALVLCATKDQCDEIACALNEFCASLHLIVHNLFEPYPPMPADKRAEVVVATPPLWESLAKFAQHPSHARLSTASQNEGLEDLLLKVEGEGQVPPTYDLTRWRPYSLTHVAQLVIFDVELQINMGFGALLQHLLGLPHEPSPVRCKSESSSAVGKLPLSCQLYAVAGGDRFAVAADTVSSVLEAIRTNGRLRFNHGTAELSLISPCPVLDSDEDGRAPLSHGVRKRQRTVDGVGDHSGEERPWKANATTSRHGNGTTFEGILIRSALSHGRLLADFTAFTDFVSRVMQEASTFWESFESGICDDSGSHGTPSPASSPLTTGNKVRDVDHFPTSAASASFLQCARVELALICANSASPGSQSCLAASETYRAQEVGVWVHSAPSSPASLSSRLTLLFQHLNDRLNGELFDGSVVQCVLASDVARLPFTLSPITASATDGQGSRLVQHHELFCYGPNLMQPALLCVARKSGDEAAAAAATRNAERIETLSVVEELTAVARGAERSPGCVPRCCFLSTPPHAGQAASSSLASTVAPSDVSTVLVVRHVAPSSVALCGGERTTSSQTRPPGEVKPLALYLLEECCQYGRVLSYYAYEATRTTVMDTVEDGQEAGGSDGEGLAAQTETAMERGQPCATEGQLTTASLFIEFASADSAVEAVRLLSRRFAFQHQQPQSQGATARLPRARLFTNRTYYEGVLQELSSQKRYDGAMGRDQSSDDDSRFSDLHISLLAE